MQILIRILLVLSPIGVAPVLADQNSIHMPESSAEAKQRSGLATLSLDNVVHTFLNPTLTKLASNLSGPSALSAPVPGQWCVDTSAKRANLYPRSALGLYGWNPGFIINSDGSLSPSNQVIGFISSVAGWSGSVVLTSSDLTDSTAFGRGLVEAPNAAAAKTLLSITSADVSGLAASATTNTTNASNITSGTLSTSRLATGAAAANLGFTPLSPTGSGASLTGITPSQVGAVSKSGDTLTGALNFNGPYTATAGAAAPVFNIGGSLSGTLASGSVFYLGLLDFTDTVAAPSGYVYPAVFTDRVNSTSVKGIRPGLTGQTIVQSAVSNAADNVGGHFFAGISGVAAGGVTDSGTASAPVGNLYGLTGNCTLLSGALYWNSCQGMNVSLLVNAGSSVFSRVGYSAESDGDLQGSVVDAAFDVFGGAAPSPGWVNGFLVDDATAYPISSGGTILKGGNGTAVTKTLHAGIDFSMLTGAWTGTGNAIMLPANNGGIQWAAGAAGGKIVSATAIGGMEQRFNDGNIAWYSGGTLFGSLDSTGQLAVISYRANGTAGVTCSAGISATTGRSVNGIITAC